MAWTDYSTAPEPGTVICHSDEVTGVHALSVTTGKGEFPLLVLRADGIFRAYVNACPHQYLPLNYRGDRLLSADGTMLLCTGHGARFDIHTGAVVSGADCGLDAVPVTVVDGMLRIAS
ncbi:Rieske (2Fe-2S) protein [Paracoccus salsus]|uniref:Rieske (2Fe-2S) protein n=1 Tax=Paracoccus salsus TaxID=2911061 RepID=UPI001F26CEA6|nr:Rieske 2Fe-2S domain-containing protein [Paracoccus salsus]MCF3972721.1 Rieske 2Fe-2S domain-containing protein [Paracoccus salsus]